MTVLNYFYVAAAVLLLFGAAVFVHEWGHYWMARRRGLKVEAFAIGFGPKLLSWTKDEIEYSWRLIPAGGFVKLPQMVTSEALEGKHDEEPLPPVSPVSKILVAVAGPFMNVVFAFVIATIIYFVGLPVLVNPSIIGYVEPGSAEAKAGIMEGDRIVAVNGQRVSTWREVQETTVLARTNILPVIIERNKEEKEYLLEAKSNDVIGGKFLNLDPRDHPEVLDVQSGSAAEAAGIKVKDVVIAFAGVPIASRDQFITLVSKAAGVATDIEVKRGDEKVMLKVTPRQDPSTKRGLIGVALGSSSKNEYIVQKPGPLPWTQVKEVWDKTIATFSALFHSKETGVGPKDLAGPVGILALLAAQVNADYRLALSFLVLLNVNLAFLNLLPLPVLDGGHILLAIIEKIRRRPLSPKFQEYATTAFALLLISFMLYVSFHDIKRFRLFKAMFQQENRIEQSAPASGK
ncbi:MAG: RIP metalloprotease RseP [Verrucomicrobiota bacterium]|nr:RIP metalloprotease RseP [Verrucomicrobiota bacterium]